MIDSLERIIWSNRQVSLSPDLKPDGKNWLMDTMPFNAVLKETLQDDAPLQYLCEGKYISFKPVSKQRSKGLLSKDKGNVSYPDGLGKGVSLEVHISRDHWRKLIRIDSMEDVDTSKEFVEFRFEVESDFNIPERENDYPRIRLGENSFIEVAQAWDSSNEPYYEDNEFVAYIENKIKCRSFFKRELGKLYFIKQIPSEWLKKAKFPVWTDTDITYGTAVEFEDGSTKYCNCCEIDTNKVAIVYMDDDDGDAGKVVVCTISGTTITAGTPSEFASNVNATYQIIQLAICKLDTNKFMVGYANPGDNDSFYLRAGTVSGTTVSWGTVFDAGDYFTQGISLCQLDTDLAAACTSSDYGITTHAIAWVFSVSGTTITQEDNELIADSADKQDSSSGTAICKLDSGKFLCLYQCGADNDQLEAVVCVYSGGTITDYTAVVVDSNDTTGYRTAQSRPRVRQLDTDKAVAGWNDLTNSQVEAVVITASGTTLTVHTPVVVDTANGYYVDLVILSTTSFLIIYEDTGNSEKGTSRLCSISGTTITVGDEEIWHDAQTSDISCCLFSSTKILVAYRDDADATDHGEAIVGDTSPVVPPTVTTQAADGIGFD